jgi:hypothetical protein
VSFRSAQVQAADRLPPDFAGPLRTVADRLAPIAAAGSPNQYIASEGPNLQPIICFIDPWMPRADCTAHGPEI